MVMLNFFVICFLCGRLFLSSWCRVFFICSGSGLLLFSLVISVRVCFFRVCSSVVLVWCSGSVR